MYCHLTLCKSFLRENSNFVTIFSNSRISMDYISQQKLYKFHCAKIQTSSSIFAEFPRSIILQLCISPSILGSFRCVAFICHIFKENDYRTITLDTSYDAFPIPANSRLPRLKSSKTFLFSPQKYAFAVPRASCQKFHSYKLSSKTRLDEDGPDWSFIPACRRQARIIDSTVFIYSCPSTTSGNKWQYSVRTQKCNMTYRSSRADILSFLAKTFYCVSKAFSWRWFLCLKVSWNVSHFWSSRHFVQIVRKQPRGTK